MADQALALDPAAYLASKGIQVFRANGNEVTCHCLFCPDGDPKGKGKLYLNTESWLYECKRCGERGNRRTMLKHFGDTDELAYLPGQDPVVRRAVLEDAVAVAAEMLANNDDMLGYLVGRGLRASTIRDYRLGYVPANWGLSSCLPRDYAVADKIAAGVLTATGKEFFSNKIVIPYLQRGSVVQVRAKDPKGKYLTPNGESVRMFNADRLAGAEDVIITEGEFDALVLQQVLELSPDPKVRATAVVGIPGADALPVGFETFFTEARRVYVALDPDDTGKKAAIRIKEMLGSKARIVGLPEDLPKCDWTEYLITRGHKLADVQELLATAAGKRLWSVADAGAKWRRKQVDAPGIRTGFTELDAWFSPGLEPGDLAVVLAKTGVGKQGFDDDEVLTPVGVRRWGDLAVGDEVWGSDGTPTRITGSFPQGSKERWRVTFSDGSSADVGDEHLWTVKYRSGKYRQWTEAVMSTRELRDAGLRHGKEWKFIIPMVEPVQWPERDLPVGPYTLGSLIANGALSGGMAVLTTPDRAVAERCRSEGHALVEHVPSSCTRWGLPTLMPLIRELGLHVRSGQKFIPQPYLQASVKQRIALLQGLMDGDGSARKGRGQVLFHTSSALLARDVRQLVQSLGGTATLNSYDRTDEGKGVEYRLGIMLPSSVEPFSTGRKVPEPGRYTRQPRRAITSIEPTGVYGQATCIKVAAPDSLYCMGTDYVVTHNTNFLCSLAYNTRSRPQLLISLEMTAAQVYERLRRIYFFHHPLASDEDVDAAYAQLRIVDENRLGEGAIAQLCDEYAAEMGQPAQLVMVDYLGYYAKGCRGVGQYEKTTNGVMALKAEAKAADVALVAPHQVNRMAENGKPIEASDARDSGAVEETADLLVSLYRPDDAIAGRSESVPSGVVRLGVLKNRKGGIGMATNLLFSAASLALVDAASPEASFIEEENRMLWRGDTYPQVLTYRRSLAARQQHGQLRLA